MWTDIFVSCLLTCQLLLLYCQIVYSFSLGNSSLGKALSDCLSNFVIIETVALQNSRSAHFTAAWLVISITDIFSYVNMAFLIPRGWTIFSSFIWVSIWTHMVANTRVRKVHVLCTSFSSWSEGGFFDTYTVQGGLWVLVLYAYTVLREMPVTYCKWTLTFSHHITEGERWQHLLHNILSVLHNRVGVCHIIWLLCLMSVCVLWFL
jgi:hypothetical protein